MFADPPRSLYLFLIVAAIVAGGVAARYQSRKTFANFLTVAGVLLGLFLVDTFVESPREEATRRVRMMAGAVEAASEADFLPHVAPGTDFERLIPWQMIHVHRPRIAVWDFSRDDFSVNDSTDEITIGFMAKGEVPGGLMLKYVKACFRKQTDGAWKLEGVEFFNPATKQKEPLPGM